VVLGTARRRTRGLLPGVVLSVLLVACSGGPALPDLDVVADASGVAPTVGGVLVDGGWGDAAAFVAAAAEEGRPSVVNVFASWCAPCVEELPLLLAASAADPSVAWLGIDSEDLPRERGEDFVADQSITWPVLYDPAASVHIALEGRVMPVTAFFGADGVLVDVVQGQLDEARLDDLLARLEG
jgi:thiol-disulfide isomerase/thioredoxin